MEKMVKLNPGNLGGTSWDDCGKTKVVQILISHGESLINSIQFAYDVDEKVVCSEMYGQPNGSNFDVVTFDHPNEYLVSVSGYYTRQALVSITFGSNKCKYGPFGKVKIDAGDFGEAFMYNFKQKSSFGGFHGSVWDFRVHRIGVYIKPLESLDEIEA